MRIVSMHKPGQEDSNRSSATSRPGGEEGFIAAPILYMLLLAGVAGGVVAASQLEVMRSMVDVQNKVSAKQDLLTAAKVLSAETSTSGGAITPLVPGSDAGLNLA